MTSTAAEAAVAGPTTEVEAAGGRARNPSFPRWAVTCWSASGFQDPALSATAMRAGLSILVRLPPVQPELQDQRQRQAASIAGSGVGCGRGVMQQGLNERASSSRPQQQFGGSPVLTPAHPTGSFLPMGVAHVVDEPVRLPGEPALERCGDPRGLSARAGASARRSASPRRLPDCCRRRWEIRSILPTPPS